MTEALGQARAVHAVLAAGVENPALIAAWRADPAQLRRLGVEPADIDLDALWKFAGLTIKVRHNGLRDDYPLTFRVMSAIGLEIELFAAYAGQRGARLAPTTEQRVVELMAFLERWLDRARPDHLLLWDAIRHERALVELRRAAGEGGASGGVATARSVPRVRGALILHEMSCDPRAIAGALTSRVLTPDAIPRAPTCMAYWRADSLAILALDELGYYLLSRIDGKTSAAALHRALGLTGKTSPVVLDALTQLAALGVIGFGPPP